MKSLWMCIPATILAIQTVALCAQAPQKPEPQFTLTISEYHHEFGPGLHRLTLVETNISKQIITEPGCVETRGWFTVAVLYNGAPLKEKDEAGRRQSETEQGQLCNFGLGINEIQPGESRKHWVSVDAKYDVSRPGIYEVTVSRETDPDHPEKSVTVKSNTLTIVVPEPGETAPK